MKTSRSVRWGGRWQVPLFLLGGLVFIGSLRLLTDSLERRGEHQGLTPYKEELKVGHLPVTCHLTCPVTDFASKTSRGYRFVAQRFSDFPTVSEAFKAGHLKATFLLAPLAMKLREQGVPVKIVYLGHRDGSTLIVAKNSQAKDLGDLVGKRVAIPSKFSNQYLVLNKLIEDKGLSPKDLHFVEIPPPDMPAALAAGAIDAYFVGEPHPARAELDGTGRILHHAKDIWPGFISCVLVVSEDLIREKRALVADLVRGIAESGEWAERNRLQAAELAAPYFRQDPKLLRYVLTQPKDRVSYRTLNPSDVEMLEIRDLALKVGIISTPVTLESVLDRSFVPRHIVPPQVLQNQHPLGLSHHAP